MDAHKRLSVIVLMWMSVCTHAYVWVSKLARFCQAQARIKPKPTSILFHALLNVFFFSLLFSGLFYLAFSLSFYFFKFPKVVLDLMDSVEDKCSVVLACRRMGIPVVEAGAAGGKRDPTKVSSLCVFFPTVVDISLLLLLPIRSQSLVFLNQY